MIWPRHTEFHKVLRGEGGFGNEQQRKIGKKGELERMIFEKNLQGKIKNLDLAAKKIKIAW